MTLNIVMVKAMEPGDSKASSCNGETGRSASWLCCTSPQMCAVIDNVYESVLLRQGCLILLLNKNTRKYFREVLFTPDLNQQTSSSMT